MNETTIITPHLSWVLLLLIKYKYGMVILAALLEGPTVGIFCGFLVRLGYFDFFTVYLTLMGADLVGDAVWYAVGYFGAARAIERYGKFVSVSPEIVAKIETRFKKHPNLTVLISKMTAGFGFAILVLITAGMIRIPAKNYAAMSILGGIFWSALLMSVGYFFGNAYTQIDKGLQTASLFVFAILAIALLYGFSRYMRRRIAT